MRLRRVGRMPLVSPRLWWRRLVFWVGAVVVACVAVAFAQAANWVAGQFLHVIAGRAWLAFVIAPTGLVTCFLLTRHVFPGAQGSGIPQTIAEEIQSQERERHGKGGKNEEPPITLNRIDDLGGIAEQQPPTGEWRLYPYAEKAEK